MNNIVRWLLSGGCFTRVARFLLASAVILSASGCDLRRAIEPPFSPANDVAFVLERKLHERRGLTGDGLEFQTWRVSGAKKTLAKLISPHEIMNRLVWLEFTDSRFNEAFAFLTRFDEFGSILPEIQLILKDPDARLAFEDMFSSERGIEACSLWICSPKNMKIIYVSAKG